MARPGASSCAHKDVLFLADSTEPNPPISAISPWTGSPDIEKLVQQSGFMVVMPDGGKAGFYSDWQAGPRWETFHTTRTAEFADPAVPGQYPRRGSRGVDGRSRRALDYYTRRSNGDPTTSRGPVSACSGRKVKIRWHFRAILMQTWIPGSSTTRTTSHHNSKAPGYSYPPATAVRARSTLPERRKIPSKPPSEPKTGVRRAPTATRIERTDRPLWARYAQLGVLAT